MKGLIFSDIMKTRLKYMENSQNPSSVLGSTFSSCMTEVTKEPLFYDTNQFYGFGRELKEKSLSVLEVWKF